MSNNPLPPPPPSVNQVTSALYGPCAVNPFMLVGTFGFDVLTGFISIFSPNWKDTIKAGTGRSWIHQLKEVMIDADERPPKWWIRLQEGSVQFFELADLFIFWFMVGFVTVEQALGWTSQIWGLSGCSQHPNEFYLSSKVPNGIMANNFAWQPNSSWEQVHGNLPYSEMGTHFTFPANSSAVVIQMCHWTNLGGNQDRPVDCRLVDLDTGDIYFEHLFDFEHHDLHLTNGVILQKFFTGNRARTLQWEARMAVHYGDIYTWANDGHFYLHYAVWDPKDK